MDQLPDEILIKILSYLSSLDLFQFFKVFDKYSYFLKERSIIHNLNLTFMWQFHNDIDVPQFILNKISYNYINVLNINYLYWLSLQDIRELLCRLTLLQEFYAVDTKIGVREKDVLLYSRVSSFCNSFNNHNNNIEYKLKKISVSAEANQLEAHKTSDFYYNCLYPLQKLCLKFSLKKGDFDELYVFLSSLKNLSELWIYDNDEENGINYERIIVNLPNLNKLVIKSKRALAILDLSCWGLLKTFQTKRYEYSEESIFERLSIINNNDNNSINYCYRNPIEEAWETLKSLHCDVPWGPKDSKVNILRNYKYII